MGDSDGVFSSFESISADIRSAVDEVTARMPERRVVLVGLCDGASACAMYVSRDSRIDAMVLINPWVRSATGEAKVLITRYYGVRIRQWEFWRRLFAGEISLEFSFASLAQNVRLALHRRHDEPSDFTTRMLKGFEEFSGRVLVVLSGNDLTAQEFLSLTRASAAWRDATQRPNVTTNLIEEADHTFSGRSQIDRLTSSIVRFVSPHV